MECWESADGVVGSADGVVASANGALHNQVLHILDGPAPMAAKPSLDNNDVYKASKEGKLLVAAQKKMMR